MTVHADVAVLFHVTVDHADLGLFTGCEGLGAEVVMEERPEGGNNAFVWQLPTRLRYPTIRLTRHLGSDSSRVAAWLADLATGVRRSTAQITVLGPDGRPIVSWGLLDVVPVRWQGPTYTAGTTAVVTETVEIAHHGFVNGGGR